MYTCEDITNEAIERVIEDDILLTLFELGGEKVQMFIYQLMYLAHLEQNMIQTRSAEDFKNMAIQLYNAFIEECHEAINHEKDNLTYLGE